MVIYRKLNHMYEGMCVIYYSFRYIMFSLSVCCCRNYVTLNCCITWQHGLQVGWRTFFLKGGVVAECDVMKAATTAASSPAASEYGGESHLSQPPTWLPRRGIKI